MPAGFKNTAKTGRQDPRSVVGMQLLRSGVEPNPGPRMRGQKASTKGKRAVRGPAPQSTAGNLVVWRDALTPARHPITRIRRSKDYGVIATSTVSPLLTSYYFALNALANYTELTSLYDSYRIVGVRFRGVPSVTQMTTRNDGFLVVAPDFDDNTAPSTTDDLLQYGNCQVIPLNQGFQIDLKPRPAIAGYGGAFTSYGIAAADQWFDLGSPGVQYYGVKIAASTTTSVVAWNLTADFMIEVMSTR